MTPSKTITPFSQLWGTLLFAGYALLHYNPYTLPIQGALIIISLLFYRKSIGNLDMRSVAHIVPVLLFVFVVNCIRGNGEILLRAGIFIVVKQGILRGIYYCFVIGYLFVMSRLLTRGFPEGQLLASLAWIGMFFGKWRGDRVRDRRLEGEFVFLLFHVMRMFHIAYAEIKVFLRRRGDGADRTMRNKIVLYFRSVYRKSLKEFELEDVEMEKKLPLERVRLLPLDYLYLALQHAVLVAAHFLGRGHFQNAGVL